MVYFLPNGHLECWRSCYLMRKWFSSSKAVFLSCIIIHSQIINSPYPMGRYNIAVIAGGFSGEYAVSLRSAAGLISWIDRSRFTPYLIVIERDGWYVRSEGEETKEPILVDKCDFSFMLAGQHIQLDYALITVHGTPGENGLLQGYLDLVGVPYNTGSTLTEALTFNKYYCNRYLSTYPHLRIADSVRLQRHGARPSSQELIDRLGLPLFAKPNAGGSSVATSKVESLEALDKAIALAFDECDEVLLERFIAGTEVTCGCYRIGDKTTALPVTEVVPKNSFFDFEAKYNGAVEEITPARISPELTTLIQTLTEEIYQHIDARGIIRVDYIIEADGRPTLLEVNTTPGMTPTSFIPQQVAATGLTMQDLLTQLIEDHLS